MVLLCRLGLMAVLLVRSGWLERQLLSWALLSLPLAEALPCVLPLYWPRALQMRAYPLLVRGMHHLYRLALMALGAPIAPLKKALPLAYRLQRAILGQWRQSGGMSLLLSQSQLFL